MTKEKTLIEITPLQARLLNRMCFEELEQEEEWLRQEKKNGFDENYLSTRKRCIEAIKELQEQVCTKTEQAPYESYI